MGVDHPREMHLTDAEKASLMWDYDRIKKLFDFGIFARENIDHVLFRSAFIDMIICLADLVQFAAAQNRRVSFRDDVVLVDNVNDITGAIREVRAACCHVSSGNNRVKSPRIRVQMHVSARQGRSVSYGGFAIENLYADDYVVYFGVHRLYMTRHIQRAFREVTEALSLPITR